MSRTKVLLIAHALTAVVHVVPAAALRAILEPVPAALTAAAIWLFTAARLPTLASDPRRPRWVVRVLDEPTFCHWSASLFGLPLLALGVVGLEVARWSGVALDAAPFRDAPIGVPELALASYAIGFGLAGWGVWGERRRLRVRTVELPIPGLDPALDGLRLAHLSDLHIGGFDSVAQGGRWVDRANALEPDIVVVTGDLVTSGAHWYEDAAQVIARLKGRLGVFVSLGNHDQWDPPRLVGELQRGGARVLLNAWELVGGAGAGLVIAGLDDRYTNKDDLPRTLAGRPEGVPTVLLAHYPDSFPDAVGHDVELVLSGHTHGGQIGVPFLAEHLHLGTLTRHLGGGLYRRGRSALHVSAGLGTTGPPLRLGIPPEIALLILRSTAAETGAPGGVLS